jgi:hypothetical protein
MAAPGVNWTFWEGTEKEAEAERLTDLELVVPSTWAGTAMDFVGRHFFQTREKSLEKAYELLGVSRSFLQAGGYPDYDNVPDKELNRQYHHLMSMNHPDKVVGKSKEVKMRSLESTQKLQVSMEVIRGYRTGTWSLDEVDATVRVHLLY